MKKIVILGYKFHGYELEIVEELKKRNQVKFINIKLGVMERIFYKLMNLISSSNTSKIKEKMFEIKIKKIESKIDILFVLNIYSLNNNLLKIINEKIKADKKIFYTWDSINILENKKIIKEYKKFFDDFYSFDLNDCEKYGLKYRETFYSQRLNITKEDENLKYLSCFVGNYTEQRAKYLELINKIDKYQNYYFLYVNPIRFFLFYKKKGKEFIKFWNLSRKKYCDIMSDSKIIIDLLQFKQYGVTQRILDALYLQKKVITNNNYIKEYNFFNPNNIFIINEKTTLEDIEVFIKKEYIEVPKDIIYHYSLEKWIKDIFEGD